MTENDSSLNELNISQAKISDFSHTNIYDILLAGDDLLAVGYGQNAREVKQLGYWIKRNWFGLSSLDSTSKAVALSVLVSE